MKVRSLWILSLSTCAAASTVAAPTASAGPSSSSATSPSSSSSSGGTRTVIEIGSPNFRAYPMAVPDARDMGGGPAPASAAEITNVLRWDFDVAAALKVLNPKGYLADPTKGGLAAASIKWSDWVSVGAEGLVQAGVTETASSLRADMRFYDVGTGRQVLQKSYEGRPEDARAFAHAFADEVVYQLTGAKGIFRTQICAVKRTRTGRELWVMDMDGSNAHAITNNGSINILPAWSRSGREIYFTSYIRHNPNLYAIAVGGGKPRLVSGETGLNTGGQEAPSGDRLALTLSRDGNSEIYTVATNGSHLKRLTKEWAIDSSPSWSPDGRQIAFVSARFGDPHIFVMNADGSNVHRVTDRGTYNQTPDWSPKGDLIAFTARDERNVFDIFTVNPTTKEIRRLTQDQGNNEEPSFSPDGNHIVFTSTRNGDSHIFIMAVDGSNPKRLGRSGGFSTPAWSPYLQTP
ncbi:MAG: Tol-Pal system beta propeller repeat protein TolB [Deltaproteobacteria bacterium]|nr:Tol-Pal system beta propeller repeat protein TolB [Deltaproteobacteria bacterium]